jgi:hypothetical protein
VSQGKRSYTPGKEALRVDGNAIPKDQLLTGRSDFMNYSLHDKDKRKTI